ncbi:replication initiation protein RepM [Psychrobacter frigidicola]|uniref:replication initiation protein RepM n=1 Tax=Psychrobacter frigidicola TaxID=45611 RepID=UPI001919288A|nr:replication initiation protein RepM [Psychrobacter frigidicola]
MSKLVIKDNALINASYGLSLVEQRLVLLAIVEARENNANPDYEGRLIVTAESYMKHFDVTRNAAYAALKAACSDLLERRFSYQEVVNGKVENFTSRWVSEVGYAVNDAYVKIRFAQAVIPLIPLIDELKSYFTSYELIQVASLNSGYAVRLYELCIAWRSTGKVPKIGLQELREKLGVLDNEYQRMERFKTRVLDLAVKQVNDFTDINIKYEQHRTGRAITGFTFTFKQKAAPKQTAIDDGYIKMTDKQISTFSSKLAALPELGSNAPIGGSVEQFAKQIADDLKDADKQKKYSKHLAKLGFKAAKSKVK